LNPVSVCIFGKVVLPPSPVFAVAKNGYPFFATANVKMFIGFSKKTDNNFNGE
jgi:hypothetical protein